MLTKVESLPGVHLAQGVIEDESRLVDKKGKAIGKAGAGVAIGIDPSADQSLNPLQLVTGQWPTATVRSRSTKRPPRSSTSPSARPSARSATDRSRTTRSAGSFVSERATRSAVTQSASTTSSTAQKLFDKVGKFDLIRIGAENGVTDAELHPADQSTAVGDDAGEDRCRSGQPRTARSRRKG